MIQQTQMTQVTAQLPRFIIGADHPVDLTAGFEEPLERKSRDQGQ